MTWKDGEGKVEMELVSPEAMKNNGTCSQEKEIFKHKIKNYGISREPLLQM